MIITEEYIKNKIKEMEKLYHYSAKDAYKNMSNEAWDQSRIFLGQMFAYEEMLAYLKDMNNREYRIYKKSLAKNNKK